MNIFLKIALFLLGSGLGVLMMVYAEPLVRTFGKSAWAEEKMQTMGGSYFLWKMVGLVFIIISFLLLVGTLDFLFVR